MKRCWYEAYVSRRALSMSAGLHPTARRAAISSPMVIGPGVRHDCPFASGGVTSAVHNLFRAVISCGVSLIGTNPAPTERHPTHEVRGGGRPFCSDYVVEALVPQDPCRGRGPSCPLPRGVSGSGSFPRLRSKLHILGG